MKIISIVGSVIAILIAISGIAISILKLITMYGKAQIFNEMSKCERLFLRVIDKQMYLNLRDSYDFISLLPLIGKTL